MADNNPFDQFDAKAQTSANPFDQFDNSKGFNPLHIDPELGIDSYGRTADQQRRLIGNLNQPSSANDRYVEAMPDRSAADGLSRAQLMNTRNLAQGAAALPGLVHDFLIERPYNYLAEKLGSDSRLAPASEQVDTMLQMAGIPTNEADFQPQNAMERVAGSINRGVGSAITGVGIGNALKSAANPTVAAIGTGLSSNPGAQLAAGGSAGASSEIAKEAGAGPAGQLVAGLAGGLAPSVTQGATEGIASAAARAMEADPAAQALAQKAMAMGIPLKASQISGGKAAQFLDSASGFIPGSGAQTFDKTQRAAFNRALSETIGAPSSDAITPQVFAQAKANTSRIYDDVLSRNSLEITPQLRQALATIRNDAQIYGPSANSQIQEALNRIGQNVRYIDGKIVLPGDAFKALDSTLGRVAGKGGEGAASISDMQQALRDAFENGMSPVPGSTAAQAQSDAELLRLANSQWRNQKTIEPLVAKDTGDGISPQALMARVTSNNAGRASMATGRRGDIGDLAQIGQKFLKAAPSSGTAERGAALRTIGDAGKLGTAFLAGNFLSPVTGLLGAAGTVASARGVQNFLANPNLVRQMAGLPANYQDQLLQLQSRLQGTASGLQANQ
jgi:hypothetical protein